MLSVLFNTTTKAGLPGFKPVVPRQYDKATGALVVEPTKDNRFYYDRNGNRIR